MTIWKTAVNVWKIAFWLLVALSAFTSEPRRELPVTRHSEECHQYEIIWYSPACRLLGIHANTNK